MENRQLLNKVQSTLESKFPSIIVAFEGFPEATDDKEVKGCLSMQIFNASEDIIPEIEQLLGELREEMVWPSKKSLSVLIWDEEDTKEFFADILPSLEVKQCIRHLQSLIQRYSDPVDEYIQTSSGFFPEAVTDSMKNLSNLIIKNKLLQITFFPEAVTRIRERRRYKVVNLFAIEKKDSYLSKTENRLVDSEPSWAT